ncbi:hypothetical protein ACPA9J_16970 [Pseudomonas aeruginosa]
MRPLKLQEAHMTIQIAERNSFRKLVDTSGFYSTTFNQFEGVYVLLGGEVWSVYVAKFIDGTEKDGASWRTFWIDETGNPMTERKLHKL